MLNDKVILTVTTGKLNEVDNFIIKNKISKVNDLYDYISDNIEFDLNDDTLEFVIQYKHGGEIKNKPLLFSDELISFNKCDNKDTYIYELLVKDKRFKYNFDKKYINKLLNVTKNITLVDSARDYLYNMNQKTFSKLYYSLVSKKVEGNIKNKTYDNFEDLQNALEKRVYSYSKEREMYFDTYFWGKTLPINKIIVNNSEKIDEFDEQIKYGSNVCERLRVNGVLYNEYVEKNEQIIDVNTEDYIENIVTDNKKSVKKKVKKRIDKNQLSFFE